MPIGTASASAAPIVPLEVRSSAPVIAADDASSTISAGDR